MKVTEHTNTLPWQADPNDDYWILGGVTGGKVAEVTFPEDRPLVVRAVNCHTDLVAALETVEWRQRPTILWLSEEYLCSICWQRKQDGHTPDCPLAATLAKAKKR